MSAPPTLPDLIELASPISGVTTPTPGPIVLQALNDLLKSLTAPVAASMLPGINPAAEFRVFMDVAAGAITDGAVEKAFQRIFAAPTAGWISELKLNPPPPPPLGIPP